MKKETILIFSSFIYLCWFYPSYAQTISIKRIPSGKDTINNKVVTILGFDMSNEITNKEYRAFVDYLKQHPKDSLTTFGAVQKNGTVSFKKTSVKNSAALKDIIDTMVMDEKIKHYFSNKAYDNYPVVGVSYNNAILFCIWKTNMDKTSGMKDASILYRLPTAAEWVHAASYLNAEWPVPEEKKGKVQPVKSGNFDKNGLYNLSGNVSEWTSTSSGNDKYVVMGGSWKTKVDKNEKAEMLSDARTDYIGFRMVTTNLRSK